MWSKEQGWSRKLGPYLLYGFVFALVVSVGRFFSTDHIMGGNALSAVPSLIVGPLVGLLAWGCVRLCDRLLYARHRAP